VLPDELVEGSSFVAECECPARIRDRSLDLAAMADDPCVLQQACDVSVAELGHRFGIEPGEGRAEVLSFAQDRQPRKAGLEALEATAVRADHARP